MNNYLNNYNFVNDYKKSQKYINEQYEENMNKLNFYDPYQGFIRGNMFQNLYDSYKIKEPYEIKPMNEQAEMLTYIDSLCFACIDLGLYLDVYPNDRNATLLFNQYRDQKNNLINDYQNKFGPILLNSDSLNTIPWAWNNRPWPWES